MRIYADRVKTHLDERLIAHVQKLVKLNSAILILPEGTGSLLGSGLFTSGNVGLS